MMFDDDNFSRYKDRIEAGEILVEQLAHYTGQSGIVLAIPRGGVPIGYIVAKALRFDLDIILTKKIGHPFQKEYAIGAVSLTDRIVVPHEEVPSRYIEEETIRIREHLKQMYQQFNGNRPPEKITGKVAIIVDDGIATGNTILTIINMVKKQEPSKLIIAVPVAAGQSIAKLSNQVDEIVCPLIPDFFMGVGDFYKNFDQVSNEEVKYYLDSYRKNFSTF